MSTCPVFEGSGLVNGSHFHLGSSLDHETVVVLKSINQSRHA